MNDINNKYADNIVWYVIKTNRCREVYISKFLTESNVPHFIPLQYIGKNDSHGNVKRVLVPVIHNMLFIRKTLPEKDFLELISSCQVPMYIIKKDNSTDLYEIPNWQMTEFRMFCDPEYIDKRYVTQAEAEAKIGKEVLITQGPFKNIKGKLVRYGNEYYVVKVLAGIGVMVRISRWYCKIL